MATFNIPLNQITIDTINGLINNATEGTQVEFKRQLNINNDEEKREFLGDVCSFATFNGGDIIYGMSEVNGMANAIEPLIVPNLDALKRQITEVIRNNITPPINFEIQEFVVPGGHVLLLRIFKLFPGPPMITFRGLTRFYSRGATSKYQLNYFQIRDSFLSSENLNEKFKNFKEDRINLFLSGVNGNNPSKPFLIFWFYPLTQIGVNFETIVLEDLVNGIYPINSHGADFAYTIDGFNVFERIVNENNIRLKSNLLFFNGAFESYNDHLLELRSGVNPNIVLVNLRFLENFIHSTLHKVINFYSSQNIPISFLVSAALINVRNAQGTLDDGFNNLDFTRNQRESLLFQDYILNIPPSSLDNTMKSLFNELWRAFGIAGTTSFNENGQRTRNFR